jgi:hypothetical protein
VLMRLHVLQVELLELLSEVDMKVIAYLEVLCTQVRRGNHQYTGVRTDLHNP